MRMKRINLILLLVTSVVATKAQIDFKLYFANNVGDVTRVSRITSNDQELTWEEATNGAVAGNRKDVQSVKAMFKEKRQKTREDQKLFWKMRDDNLLCFRINDGKGKSGEFEARVRSGSRILKKNVTNYFFVNTDNHEDSLFISVNRKGCGTSPSDTLHFKYYIYDWGNENLLLFKLDSRRQKTGLTYQFEYEMQDFNRTRYSRGFRELSGKSFQSVVVPEDSMLTAAYLVSNGQRLKLDDKRLVKGANLSDKLNRLWMGTNFTLDKHQNRELTIFNMLGSGLFEKFDTLYVKLMGKNGPVVPTSIDPKTKLGNGVSFNIAQIDAKGKYVASTVEMKYVGYDQKKQLYKLLTYGNPCYIEVYAPGCLPALYRYDGAVDPKNNELNQNRTTAVVRLAEGTPTTTGPDFSSQMIYVLKEKANSIMHKIDNTEYHVFQMDSADMAVKPSSDAFDYIADGAYQENKWLEKENKLIYDYAELSVTYSIPKAQSKDGEATLVLEEKGTGVTTKALQKTTSSVVNGNDYPPLQRSWYSQRWNLAEKSSATDYVVKEKVEYKPRLTIAGKRHDQLRYIRRLPMNMKQMMAAAEEKSKGYVFNQHIHGEFNSNGNRFFTLFGTMAKLDIRETNFPGFQFSLLPNFDILRGVYEVDAYMSIAGRTKGTEQHTNWGQKCRDNLKEQDRLKRFKYKDIGNSGYNLGFNLANDSKSSGIDKDHWAQAELDDIFLVEPNKLGWGPFFDGHIGLGFKFYRGFGPWASTDESGQIFYIKAVELGFGFGAYAAFRCDIFNHFADKYNMGFLKKLPLTMLFYSNASAEIRGGLGFKVYNFKKDGVTIARHYGGFLDARAVGKVGGGLELKLRAAQAETEEGQQEHEEILDPDDDDEIILRPKKPSVSGSQWVTRLFGLSVGLRLGGKLQFSGGIVFFDDMNRIDIGASFLAFGAVEAYADVRVGPIARLNPRCTYQLAFFKPWPDDDSNPTIPTYPNYPIKHNPDDYKKARWRAAPQVPTFLLGHCAMENLTFRTHPFFLGEDHLLLAQGSDSTNPEDDRLKEYTLPENDGKIAVVDGKELPTNDQFVQSHHVAKEGSIEMVVFEEMTPGDDSTPLTDSTFEQEIEKGKRLQIVSNSRTSKDEPWQRHVVAFDATQQDCCPKVALNVVTHSEDHSLGVTHQAACLWKRGQFVLPPYEDEGATDEEKAKTKAEFEASRIRAFEGDLMLSVFNGTNWSEPESVLKLDKEDILSGYQLLMSDNEVLAAVSILSKDKDQPELRYYNKKPGGAVHYTNTDKFSPIDFSLDMVGDGPVVAILHPIDSCNSDINVKYIGMEGEHSELGADLAIARHNPQSVRIVRDKEDGDADRADFAVVWQASDRIIHRDGKATTVDSTQTMLNCSRMYLLENLTATPHITLGCTADSTMMTGYDVFLDDFHVKTIYTLTDVRDGNTYLMKDEVEFDNDFSYDLSYSQEAMLDDESMPVNINIYNTGSTPITYVEGYVNNQHFYFNDLIINPYTQQTLTIDYEFDDDFSGLLKAHDVQALFEDKWIITKASRRRGAPLCRTVTSPVTVTEFASGMSDVKCELLSQSITGSVNKVYLELTDYDELNANETVHVGLYLSHADDVPICSTAEALLKASDFTVIGGERKAWVELTVDGLTEAVDVEIRARVYNDKVLEAMGDDDDISDAVADNLSWQDNQRFITLLPTELDDVTGLPVVTADQKQHKVKVEQTGQGVWISGLEDGDFVRIFDAAGRAAYQNSHPTERLFVPMEEHGVYLLSTGQEVVKFRF